MDNQNNDEPQARLAELMEPTALEAQVRAEIDSSVSTAKRYPRSIKLFMQRAEGMACVTTEVAASCEYKLRRGDKAIQGPSIRLAEIVAANYGNLRVGARIIEEGKQFVVAQGVAHDMESNVSYTSEVRRRITNKEGRRFNDDMIAMTCNAACAIAQRNAIFKAVPMALVTPIIEKARETARGDLATLPVRRDKMLKSFEGIGVKADRIFAALEVRGAEDITLDMFDDLRGMWTSIQDGEATADILFPDPRTAARNMKDAPKPAAAEAKS